MDIKHYKSNFNYFYGMKLEQTRSFTYTSNKLQIDIVNNSYADIYQQSSLVIKINNTSHSILIYRRPFTFHNKQRKPYFNGMSIIFGVTSSNIYVKNQQHKLGHGNTCKLYSMLPVVLATVRSKVIIMLLIMHCLLLLPLVVVLFVRYCFCVLQT